jgi:hypothetical protein
MRIVLMLAGVILLSGCSISKQSEAAANAVSGFHEMLDAGQFDSIYDASSDDLKRASTRQDFDASLEAVHRKLGSTQSANQLGWTVNYKTSGTFVRLRYGTKYSGGDAREEFVYRMQGEKASLVWYDIKSVALVTK